MLSVRVLETRNIAGNEIFPDASAGDEQWEASEDSIELPKGALIENSESGLVRIVFVAFDRLESILRPMDTTQIDPRQNGMNQLFVCFFVFFCWFGKSIPIQIPYLNLQLSNRRQTLQRHQIPPNPNKINEFAY